MLKFNKLHFVENVIKEGAMIHNPWLAILMLDYGCKSVMQTSKYQSQGESRSGWLMSMLNAAIFLQRSRANPKDGASWHYWLEHHLSKDTTQDASQIFYQTVKILDDLCKKGYKSFQFWIDGARQQ